MHDTKEKEERVMVGNGEQNSKAPITLPRQTAYRDTLNQVAHS
jgi:hypothetical protein